MLQERSLNAFFAIFAHVACHADWTWWRTVSNPTRFVHPALTPFLLPIQCRALPLLSILFPTAAIRSRSIPDAGSSSPICPALPPALQCRMCASRLAAQWWRGGWWGHQQQWYIHTDTAAARTYYSCLCSSTPSSCKFILKLLSIIFRRWKHARFCFTQVQWRG